MKRIMMTKYGFVRSPEDDFSDDGNRFHVYRVGRVRVTKLVSDGEAYISADICDGKLPYKVYKTLPHYKDLDILNGVSVDSITEDNLQKLYEDCQAYEVEYTAAENSIEYPTIQELTDRCKAIHAKRMTEAAIVENLINGKTFYLASVLSEYEWKRVRDFIQEIIKRTQKYDSDLKIEEEVIRMYKHSISFSFMSPTYSDLSDGYYYTELVKLLKTRGIN